ncbi:hypothetical protein [Kribbella endophytica]
MVRKALAVGIAAGASLAALVALQAPLCPPNSDTCLADQWSAQAWDYLTK